MSTQSATPDASQTSPDAAPTPDGAQPSAASTTTTTTDASPVKDSSTTETKADAPKSISDAVRNVLDQSRGKKADPASTPDAKPSKDNDSKAEGEAEPAEADAEDKLPFHKHPRWIKRGEELKTANADVARLKPLAEQAEKLQTFMREANLTPEDLTTGQNVMALIRNNPAEAVPALEKILTQLKEFLGQALPADLAADVEEGKISEDRAKELATARREASGSKQRAERSEAERQANETRTYNERVTAATNAWEAGLKTDPDFAKIKPLVMDKITALTSAHYAKQGAKLLTPDEAVKICKDAHKAVLDQIKGFRPAKPAVDPIATETNNRTAQASKAPTTLLGAVNQALGQRAAAL